VSLQTAAVELCLHLPAERLFSKTTPANGFEDSFKNDPVLRALQDGHIFNPYSGDDPSGHGNRTAMQSHTSIKPVVFWLLITKSSVPDDVCGRYTTEEDLYRNRAIVHKYTGLHSHSQQDRENLEDLPNWRERFPYMARSLSLNELNCEIIHMDVSLELTRESAPSGAELVTRVEIIIPGPALGKHRWQTVTSLFKPQELYYTDLNHDPPLDRKKFIADALDVNENQTRIKVPFPANTWAHALSNLTNLQYAYDDGRRAQQLDGGSHGSTRPVREYVDQISMYQEVQSAANCQECTEREVMNGYRTPRCNCGGKGEQFVTRAIILWTFNKARRGDQGSTTWRYIDPHPPRRMLMSPSPHPSHHIAASMSEHFNSWAETPMHLQNHSMLDPFVQGLATPPNTAGLQSPFVAGYGYTPNHFDVHHENISFASHATTVDSESTLVENETNANIDSFLSNTNVNLGDFDHNSNSWHMPQTESFDADPAWANYNVPASTPHIGWDNDAKNHVWPEGSPTKQVIWIEDGSGKHEQLWNDVIPIPVKQDGNFIGTSLEQKLLPWIDQHADVDGEVGRNGFHGDSNNTQLPDLDNGVNRGTSAKEQVWNGGDEGFEYEQLAERMK
jgi:transcriptional enhancer factor